MEARLGHPALVAAVPRYQHLGTSRHGRHGRRANLVMSQDSQVNKSLKTIGKP